MAEQTGKGVYGFGAGLPQADCGREEGDENGERREREVLCIKRTGEQAGGRKVEAARRTEFWAAGLFWTAVPSTQSICLWISSEELGLTRSAWRGSHIFSFSRSMTSGFREQKGADTYGCTHYLRCRSVQQAAYYNLV